MTFGYWNYYDDAFDWTGKSSFVSPDLEFTRSLLQRGGLSENEVDDYIDSGYLCFEGFDVVIDRYYGDSLASVDGRCRFRPDLLSKIGRDPQSRAKVFVANSIDDVRRIVDEFATSCGDLPLLRGQTQNHVLERKVNNPFISLELHRGQFTNDEKREPISTTWADQSTKPVEQAPGRAEK